MKKRLLLITLLFTSILLYGQEEIETKNTARFGIGKAFFGAGDVLGTAIFAEYSYSLNDYFAITPKMLSAYTHSEDEWNFKHSSSFELSLINNYHTISSFF